MILSQVSVFADTAEVPMLLTVETKPLDFTVTERIDMSVYQGETDITMNSVTVTNTGTEDLKVSSIAINPAEGWTVESASTDFATASKTALGFTCNSHDFSSGAYTPGDKLTAGSNLMYVINGKVSAKADLMSATQVASMVVTVEKAAPTLISFKISSTSYQAEEDMTWRQWIASSYNTDGYKISSDGKVESYSGAWYVWNDSGFVNPDDTIVPNWEYPASSYSGGSN